MNQPKKLPAFTIQPVTSADLESLTAHFVSVADEPLFVLTTDFPRTREQTERFLGHLRESPFVALVVARSSVARSTEGKSNEGVAGQKIIGHCLIRSTDHPALRHVAKLSMAVSEDFRRCGVGEALLKAAEDWAKGYGIHKITLDVLANNRPALRLYEKLRYREEGTRRDQVVIAGQFHDELLLAKFLQS